MHSARTEGSPPGRLARWAAITQRLNFRLVLILAGVALGTGTLRLPRRAPAPETP